MSESSHSFINQVQWWWRILFYRDADAVVWIDVTWLLRFLQGFGGSGLYVAAFDWMVKRREVLISCLTFFNYYYYTSSLSPR